MPVVDAKLEEFGPTQVLAVCLGDENTELTVRGVKLGKVPGGTHTTRR